TATRRRPRFPSPSISACGTAGSARATGCSCSASAPVSSMPGPSSDGRFERLRPGEAGFLALAEDGNGDGGREQVGGSAHEANGPEGTRLEQDGRQGRHRAGRVRREGCAFDREENEPGVCCVSAPV